MVSVLATQRERWDLVGAAVNDRMKELGWTQTHLAERSGVSVVKIRGLSDGLPLVRADKKKGLTDALGWAPDSIDRILAGGKPKLLPNWTPDPLEGRVSELESQMGHVLSQLDRLLRAARRQPPRR